MAEQYVDLTRLQLPDPRLTAWLEANHVDPGKVLADSHILLTQGYLWYVGWPPDPKVQGPHGAGYVKRPDKAPLLVSPEEFGLQVVDL